MKSYSVLETERIIDEFYASGVVPATFGELVHKVCLDAAKKHLNAAYSGEHHDGGCSAQLERLRKFLEGYNYAVTRQKGFAEKHEYNKYFNPNECNYFR